MLHEIGDSPSETTSRNRATGGVFVLTGAYLLTLERPR